MEIREGDVVMGSHYLSGVNIIGWLRRSGAMSLIQPDTRRDGTTPSPVPCPAHTVRRYRPPATPHRRPQPKLPFTEPVRTPTNPTGIPPKLQMQLMRRPRTPSQN